MNFWTRQRAASGQLPTGVATSKARYQKRRLCPTLPGGHSRTGIVNVVVRYVGPERRARLPTQLPSAL